MEVIMKFVCILFLFCGIVNSFKVVGNKIYDQNGNAVMLRGVARPSFEWSATGQYASLADYTLMKNWGANVVRLGMSQCFWLASATATSYAATIDQQVTWVKSLGMAIILDLHWSDQDGQSTCAQQLMADANSNTFWQQVATKYKNDPMILFELYNEPHDVAWSVWLNGGASGAGWNVVGMQTLYNTVRATGANNVVVIGGLNYAFDLSGIATTPVVGTNIVYNTHPYDYSGKQVAQYPAAFGYLAPTHALIATEFGEYNCNPTYNSNFVTYANSINMSYTAWGWFSSGCAFPSVITDWNGTVAATAVPVKADLLKTSKILIASPTSSSGGSSTSVAATTAIPAITSNTATTATSPTTATPQTSTTTTSEPSATVATATTSKPSATVAAATTSKPSTTVATATSTTAATATGPTLAPNTTATASGNSGDQIDSSAVSLSTPAILLLGASLASMLM